MFSNILFSQENTAPPTVSPSPADKAVATHTVKLKFLENGNGVTLKRVEVKAGDTSLFSGTDGTISLDITQDSEGFVEASKKGYLTRRITAKRLLSSQSLDVFLSPSLSDDSLIRVKGERRTNVSRKVITIQESRKVAPGGDPAQVVKLLPGVQTNAFSSEVVVRGSGPDDSVYYIDDLEVPYIYHSIGDLSVLPPSLISEVQFDSGGFGSEYGGATGGVIVLKTKNDIPKRAKSEFVFNIPFYSGLYHERPLSENSFIAVSYRRSYLDIVLKEILDSNSETNSVTVSPYFTDAHVFYLNKNDTGHTKYTLIAAENGFKAVAPTDFSSGSEGTSSFSTQNKFINFGVERMTRLNKEWKYRSTPQISKNLINNDFFGNVIGLDFLKVRMPTELTKRLSKTEDFFIGIDPSYVDAKVDVYSVIPNDDDPTFDFEDAEKEKIVATEKLTRIDSWAAIDRQLGNWKVTPGIRYYYNSSLRKSHFDPRLRSIWNYSKSTSFKFAIGQYSKSPEAFESSRSYGNPDLEYEKSVHYVTGWARRWSDAWQSDFQLFHKKTYDSTTGNLEKKYDSDGSSKTSGAEVFIRRNLTSRLFGWVSYTYSKSVQRESDEDPYRASEFDQTHNFKLVGNYRIFSQFDFGGRFSHNTGDTYSPINDAVYNANLDKYQPRESEEDSFSKRLPNQNSLTLYFTNDFLFNYWKMALKYGVESYWYTRPVFGVQNSYNYEEEAYQTGVNTVPFIELSGEF